VIEVENVSKRYGRETVLDDVSLSIERGGLTSIIGPNGAGKSTLLSVMSRLLKSDGGHVRVDGMDVTNTPGPKLARRLSILRQDNHFEARLTVRDLVAFGRYPYSGGRLTPEDHDQIEAALRYVELEELQHRFLDELSGGQRQRAFVAMVLCQDTDYVLLDEPLNSLDMKHAVGMMRRLRGVCDELGKTIVVVLHDINFASCYSDRIVAMKGGRLLRHGTPAEIMTPAMLREIYDMDVRVEVIDGNPIGVYFA
jgi:iron complex transport system ATP-binding protein